MLGRTLTFASLIGIAILPISASPDKPDLKEKPKIEVEKQRSVVGNWKAEGSNPGRNADGELVQIKYKAIVQIVKDPNADRYVVEWSMEGGTIILGVGFMEGESLVIGWSLISSVNHHRGCTIYRWSGSKLQGRWTMLPGSIGVETLERIPEPPPQKDPDV